MKARPILWSERTWPEIPGDLAAVGGAALLPVGATEQHGPQLGCGMDFVLADRVCRDVSRETGAPALPTLPYGCSLGHSRGSPSDATAERGVALYAWMVEDLAAIVTRGIAETPPLPHTYRDRASDPATETRS